MPEAVLERIIKVASNTGDCVLDPFAGSGTALAVAKRLRRRFLGIELSSDYAEGIRDRLATVMPEFGNEKATPQVSLPRGPGRKRTIAAGLKPR
jgi:site-specific DNA-methyltransferase (adenine-specific)